MRIKEISHQNRRDFWADFECEHCGHILKDQRGYDDANFHNNVIPSWECPKCNKTAGDTYRPLATKYPEGYQI